MKIVILGSGMAGCMAAGALSSYNPIVIESQSAVQFLNAHKAVMRIKDPSVALILGLPSKPITVHKAIWSEGTMRTKPTLRDNNLYSLKVTNHIDNRSIINAEKARRFLLEGTAVPKCKVITNNPVIRIESEGYIHLRNRSPEQPASAVLFDYCISTIPMPAICKITETPCDHIEFETSEITALHYILQIETADAYQTVYFPDNTTPLYRATLQDGIIIAEIIGTSFSPSSIQRLLSNSFGIDLEGKTVVTYTQKRGKMNKVNDAARKEIIYYLTNEYNIFSLGRFALWKPVRTDDLVKDLSVISEMIKSKSKYQIARKQQGGAAE